MEDSRFTYVVNPRRPIKGIQDIPAIKGSKTLKLTKEEAIICMKCGPVYRKFANEGIQERVTTANINRLHNEKFLTEKEFSGSNIEVVGKTEVKSEDIKPAPIVEESKQEKPVEEKTPVQEVENNESDNTEVKEESVNTEETAQNVEVKSDEEVNIEEIPVSEEITEESSDSEAEDDSSEELEEVKDNQSNNNITVDYNGNKRKNKKHRN